MALVLEDHAVFTRAQLREQVLLIGEAQRLRRGQERNLDAHARPFGRRHRRKARIAKGRADGVFRDVDAERPLRLQAADAAAQHAVARERDERRARLGEPRPLDRLRAAEELGFDRGARDGEERLARLVERDLRARLVERERRIADHLALAAGGIAGIAGGEQLDRKAALPRSGEKAIQRRRAAGLVVIEIGGEARNARHRGTVDLAGTGVRVVVRQIGR